MSCIYTNVNNGQITYTSKFSKDVTGTLVKMLWPGEEGYPGDNTTTRWTPGDGRWLPKQPIAVVATEDGEELWFNWACWWADAQQSEEDSPRTLWSNPIVDAAYKGSEIHLYRDAEGHQHLELI